MKRNRRVRQWKKRLAKWLGVQNQRTTTQRHFAEWFLDALGMGLQSDSGLKVDGVSLLSYAPMYSAVSRIAGHMGALSIELRKKEGNSSKLADSRQMSRLAKITGAFPNELMGGHDLRETQQSNAIVYGNGRAFIARDFLNNPTELILLRPERTYTYLVHDNGQTSKWHSTTTDAGDTFYIPDRDVVHIKNLGPDGLVGYSLIQLAKNSIGGGLAGEKAMNKTFQNDAAPGVILEAPEDALEDETEAMEFLENFRKLNTGVDARGKAILLRFGVKATKWSMSAVDAAYVDQRLLQREEAALWTRIEQMLGVDRTSAYNSTQQRFAMYVVNCLSIWFSKWEEEYDRKLLSEEARRLGYFFRVNPWPILKGSINERVQVYQIGRRIGLWSQEEMRELEGMPAPSDADTWGDRYVKETQQSEVVTLPPDQRQTGQPGLPPPDEEDDTDQDTENRLAFLVASSVGTMFERERDALQQIARKGSAGFLQRIENYYDSHTVSFRSLVGRLGGDPDVGEQWVRESKAAVINATGFCQGHELSEAIDDLTRSWSTERADQISELIMKGERNARFVS